MKLISYAAIIIMITTLSTQLLAQKPKHQKQQQNAIEEIDETSDTTTAAHGYQPNPIVLAGVGQIMNGALSIAQNPHSRPNIGHSVASMIYGIMSIIIEKVAHKKIDINDHQALEECFAE